MSLRSLFNRLFKDRDEFDLTSGSIARPMFYLSLPIVVTNLFQTAYNLADTYWLGQYSTNALAAISFAFPVVFLLISLGTGLSVAGSVLVAQHVGAGESERAEYAASQTVSIATLGSLLLSAIGYPFVDDILALLGASPAVHAGATAYMEVITVGIVFMFGFFVFMSLMRGYGDTVTPMMVMFGSVVLNIILDPFLINGWSVFPEMGIQGAAVATVVCRAGAAIVGLWIMLRGTRGVHISLSKMTPNLTYAKKLVSLGAPASLEGAGRALSVNFLLVIVGTFSTSVVAGYGIGTRVFSVIFLPAIAVSQGVETMTGQNVGAGKEGRAERVNHITALALFGLLSAVAAIVWLGAPQIATVFSNDPEVIAVSTEFLRYVAPTFGFIGVMRAYTGGFRGTGYTIIAAAITIATLGFIRLPAAWLGTTMLQFGQSGIWIAFAISNVLGGIIAYLWFIRGSWQNADVRTSDDELGHSAVANDD